jgi:hypothetical protein
MRPQEFASRTAKWLQDKNLRATNELQSHIAAAVRQYSKDRPYEVVSDVDGNATSDVSLPSGFIDGFSQIRTVEYPIGDVPATIIDENEWVLYRTPTTYKLRFLVEVPPTAAASIRVTHTAYHTQGSDDKTAAASTIPDADFEAVAALAASYAAYQIAQSYADGVDGQTDSAFVDGTGRNAAYVAGAKALRAVYDDALGMAPKAGGTSKHGQGFIDLDTPGPGYGDGLTHPRRWT